MLSTYSYKKTFDQTLVVLNEYHHSSSSADHAKKLGAEPRRFDAEHIKFTASVIILVEYEKQSRSKYKNEAQQLSNLINILGQGDILCRHLVEPDALIFFSMAVMKSIGVSVSSMDDLRNNEIEYRRFTVEQSKQMYAPSIEIQRSAIAFFLDNTVKRITLPVAGDSFASALFVLVKQLNIPVQKETMRAIIKAANFSQISLCRLFCADDKTQRAKELALLDAPLHEDALNSLSTGH